MDIIPVVVNCKTGEITAWLRTVSEAVDLQHRLNNNRRDNEPMYCAFTKYVI